jgi:hypothetical protein
MNCPSAGKPICNQWFSPRTHAGGKAASFPRPPFVGFFRLADYLSLFFSLQELLETGVLA